MNADFDLIPNLIYTFANCRLPKYCRPEFREKDEFKIEARTFVDTFLEKLLNNFEKMSLEASIRLILGFSILRLRDY